jgi:hypothetical protein
MLEKPLCGATSGIRSGWDVGKCARVRRGKSLNLPYFRVPISHNYSLTEPVLLVPAFPPTFYQGHLDHAYSLRPHRRMKS